MPAVELWPFALVVAGLFLHRFAGRVTCPACGGRRCTSAPVMHLVAGSEGDRTTSHRCLTCHSEFVLVGGDPARPHFAVERLIAEQ